MDRRVTRLLGVITIASCILATGCSRQDRSELSIHLKKHTYQNWLLQQRPFLGRLPKSAIINYDFTTLVSGTNVSPVISYDLKAGKWDGVLELWFTIQLDRKGQPVGLSEETVTFIKLPARETVTGEGGKKRNNYYGVKIRGSSEVTAIIKRVASGGDFADYRRKTDEAGEFACSFFDSNDPWKNRMQK